MMNDDTLIAVRPIVGYICTHAVWLRCRYWPDIAPPPLDYSRAVVLNRTGAHLKLSSLGQNLALIFARLPLFYGCNM